MPDTPTSLLLALREATQASHKRLEARLPFFSEGFNLARYRDLMAAYHGFHAPLETALAGYQGRERDKLPALARDLRRLGVDVQALPHCQELPRIDDEASALGVMYVLEGSTLGGQVLKQAMAERLGIDADSGGGFLDVYGPLTGTYWRSFLARLGAFARQPECEARTLQAAVATFECFERWLEARHTLLD
jgi:heme oxygenase (biliverdin-IX-beta and delta-forming)